MTRTPQLLLTLTPEGSLAVELPGFQATRRQVVLQPRTAGAVLLRMLQEQQTATDQRIGHAAAPTQAQAREWERSTAATKRFLEGIGAEAVHQQTAEDLGL